ncbi:MAG: hypothetical protein HY826_10610 [Actinobacteria bacterium]|nr:hypothetical protein [Actinomycetota bacterium]
MTAPMTSSQPTRVRHVLHRKRAVLRDSVAVVLTTARALWKDRFLLRVLGGAALAMVVALVSWKVAGRAGSPGAHSRLRPLMIGVRLMATLCVQFIVASWLYSRWIGQGHNRVRDVWRHLGRRLPAFACCAAVLGWLDFATSTSTASSLIRTVGSFVFGYALSYAVPASAVFNCGMSRAFHRSYQAFRKTFGADLFAWSGVWLVTGVVALVTSVPEALDLYTPGSGERPASGIIGRLLGWALVVPISLGALAVSAGFCTVLFFALERNQAPSGYRKHEVETVSGLQLDD